MALSTFNRFLHDTAHYKMTADKCAGKSLILTHHKLISPLPISHTADVHCLSQHATHFPFPIQKEAAPSDLSPVTHHRPNDKSLPDHLSRPDRGGKEALIKIDTDICDMTIKSNLGGIADRLEPQSRCNLPHSPGGAGQLQPPTTDPSYGRCYERPLQILTNQSGPNKHSSRKVNTTAW